jgi:NADH:ubiquinone oxidoreductase subunit 6 (subunit J)
VVLAVLIALTVTATEWPETVGRVWTQTEDVARTLFDSFVLPLEVVGVLLLAAVVGGVFLAKRERGGEPE